jgi:hypothetical protein
LERKLRYSLLAGRYAICRLLPTLDVPEWAFRKSGFCSVTQTSDELSIVCAEDAIPREVEAERGWVCLKLNGPFPFTQTGILSSFLAPLAESGIGIFAVSTFDTDYVLIKEENWGIASGALREAGHESI